MSQDAAHTHRVPRDFTMDRFALIAHLPHGRFASLASHGFDARLRGNTDSVDVLLGGTVVGTQPVLIARITAECMEVILGPEFKQVACMIVNRIAADWGDAPELRWPWDARGNTSFLEAMSLDASLLTRNEDGIVLRLEPDDRYDFTPSWSWSVKTR